MNTKKAPLSTAQKTQKHTAQTRPKTAKKPLGKGLHPRNRHNQGYDFDALMAISSTLKPFVRPNPYGNLSIDFANSHAVKALNAALLKQEYQITHWDIPEGFLCPPIPGRVDYIHYLADLLAESGKTISGATVNGLDIGTGANGIYPILGIQSYGWHFVATDIDPLAIANVKTIIDQNPALQDHLKLRRQTNSQAIFSGIIMPNERFDFCMCNPPFHGSLAEATAGSERKLTNLARNRGIKTAKAVSKVNLNFGGQKAELWCEGGEQQFLANMIKESAQIPQQVMWFTSLVSKSDNLKPCYKALASVGVDTVKTIEMTQGNKITRILAWSFLADKQRHRWTTTSA